VLAVVVCVLAAPASADDERSIAIRIEAKDIDAAKRAVALQKALRAVDAKQRKGKSPDIDSAVVDAHCKVTQPACAASIGETLGATHVLVGQLEKRGARYALTLSLVSVRTKQRVRSLREVMGGSANVAKWATALHTRMLDEGTGELVITANARRGKVLLDGLAVTELYEGRATISNIALGTHGLEIRAAGYKTFSADVEVDGRTEETVLLEME
jgi:hypothetical protein